MNIHIIVDIEVRPLMGRLVRTLLAATVVLLALAIFAKAAFGAAPAWRIAAVSGPTNLPPKTTEIQQLSVDAESGTFTLDFEGQTTIPIAVDAPASVLAANLNGLSSIGGTGGSVEVTGGPGGPGGTSPYFVRFGGALAAVNVAQLVADSSLLTGAGHTATVSTKTQGGEAGRGTIAIYVENIGGASSGGATVTLGDALPVGVLTAGTPSGEGWSCGPGGVGQSSFSCTTSSSALPGETLRTLLVPVAISSNAAAALVSRLTVGSPGALPATYEEPITVSSTPAKPGIQSFQAGAYDEYGAPYSVAGGHPYSASTMILLNTVLSVRGKVVPAGDPHDIDVALPPGFLGDPLASPHCPLTLVSAGSKAGVEGLTKCPTDTIVGVAQPMLEVFGKNAGGGSAGGVYNDEPLPGTPGAFSFQVVGQQINVVAKLRSDEDYGVTAASLGTPQISQVFGATFAFWGSPANPSHDPQRCATSNASSPCNMSSEAPETAFLTNPTSCAEEALTAPLTVLDVDTWQDPGVFTSAVVTLPAVQECAQLHFGAEFSLQPESQVAASPSAFSAELRIPQGGLTNPAGRAAPELKRSVVTLPRGVDVNPASADGLGACSNEQIGLLGTGFPAPDPIRFNEQPAGCPEDSKLGTVEAETPLLEEALKGTIYLAAQEDNPFHSLLALYLVLEDPERGILVKLPGEVRPDAQTGQLSAVFDDNPQLPVSALHLRFRGGGPRSPLATPEVCGGYTTKGEFTPWSAPESGPATMTEDSFQISAGPGGGSCAHSLAERPFAPAFSAGTASPTAGAYTPLVIRATRADGEQELKRLEFNLPAGLSGKLAGLPYCLDADIAAARETSGTAELRDPSCPAASQIGTVDTAAGIGSAPIHVPGTVYLAGPYEGAPLSTVVITPAVAGPFDLGDVVIRAPIFVEPETARLHVVSDEIPSILRGIPIQLRSVAIQINRPDFTVNPTSCEAMAIGASLTGAGGDASSSADDSSDHVSVPFKVTGCSALAFKPKLSLSLKGGTKRAKFPALTATLTQPGGEANVRFARVVLPHSELLEQGHIGTVCTRVQFNAAPRACPAQSIYGYAEATSPLLGYTLKGPVYLRSNGGERELPDLVAALRGPESQPIEIDLVGYIDSVTKKGTEKGRIRTTFALVPDAPVSKFVLRMQGGKKGLLTNSTNLCRGTRRATVRLLGQNNKRADQFPAVKVTQCPRSHGKHK